MEDRVLIKISLIATIIGLVSLFLVSEKIEPKTTNIEEIDNGFIEKVVKIKGEIVSIKETKGLYILKIKDPKGLIEAIVFKNNEEFPFKENYSVEAIGKVSKYRNNLQIEVYEIKNSEV